MSKAHIITERYTLIQGDCLEEMPALAAGSVDGIFTDLPYGTTACAWDEIIPFAPMWEQVKRLLKPRGVFVTTASQPFTSKLVMSNLEWFRYALVWDKAKPSTGLHANQQPLRQHEDVVIFGGEVYNPIMTKAKERSDAPRNANNGAAFGGKNVFRQHKNCGFAYPRSVIRFTNANQNDRLHPTQKPVALYEYLIRTYTNPGDVVLDICFGSGTTIVAALRTGRRGIGIESDAAYFQLAAERIANAAGDFTSTTKERASGQLSLFDAGEGGQ